MFECFESFGPTITRYLVTNISIWYSTGLAIKTCLFSLGIHRNFRIQDEV